MLSQAPVSLQSFAKPPIPFGLYIGSIADMSTSSWISLRRSQRKAWVYMGAFSSSYYMGFAIADAGMVATAFAYLFDAQTGEYVEEKTTIPLGFGSSFDPDLKTTWRLKQFAITPHKDEIVATYQGKRLSLKFSIFHNDGGVSTIAPAAGRPFNYSYKNLLLSSHVEAQLDGREIKYEGAIGSLDFSKGYPPRHTFWNWASLIGTTDSGIPIGINLVGDFNNGIENALWINDTVYQLSQATFSYGRPVEKSDWRIATLDGIVDMNFRPIGMRSENTNALIMLSRFKQPFGVFSGSLYLSGQDHKFIAHGVVEEHFAKW